MQQTPMQTMTFWDDITSEPSVMAQHVTDAAAQFTQYRESSSASMLEMSLIIFTRKRDFSECEFAQLCSVLGYASKGSSIRKMVAVGEKYEQLKAHRKVLPESSWTLLYKLSQVAPDVLAAAADDGRLTSTITGRDIDEKLRGLPTPPHTTKPRHTGESVHAITLTWRGLSDLAPVYGLMEKLSELSGTYGNFVIEPSMRTEAVLEKERQQSQTANLDELHREAKVRFLAGLKAAWARVPSGSGRAKAFVKCWGLSVEELKMMPINEALQYVGQDALPECANVSYADLVGRKFLTRRSVKKCSVEEHAAA